MQFGEKRSRCKRHAAGASLLASIWLEYNSAIRNDVTIVEILSLAGKNAIVGVGNSSIFQLVIASITCRTS